MSMIISKESVLLARNFERLVPLLEKSRDLRFVYEVGLLHYLDGDCKKTLIIASILEERSSSQFMSKKLKSLHGECPLL